jgi:predicted RecB family nuclease
VFLTKSRLTSAWQCQKRLWLEAYQGEAGEGVSRSQQRRIEQGIEVENYARQYFPQGILIEGKTSEEKIERTQSALEKGEKCLFAATFSFDNILVECDIILQDEPEKWQLIEVKSSNKVKDEHLRDLAIQKYVLAGNNLFLSSIQVMYLNRDCVYPDLSNLLTREEVNPQLTAFFSHLPQLIDQSQNTLEQAQIPDVKIGKHCDQPHPCPFQSFCWEGIEEPTLLSIPYLKGKKLDQVNQLIAQGIYSLHDLPEDFPLTEKQAQAVREKLNPELMINEQGILDKFLQLEYPLHFFDFETLDPAIPRFEGLKPYQHFPFQHSCHILHENCELEYHTYLHENETDPREKMIESLLETLGEKGSIIVYYQSFEAQRLGELAEQFPEYKTQLNAIKARLWDQWKLFKNDYKHPDFGGSTSLKKVLPVLVPEMSYDHLEIQDGQEAQAIWDLVIQGKAGEKREEMLASLRTYSEQDTYAMVKIHQTFLEQIIPQMQADTSQVLSA